MHALLQAVQQGQPQAGLCELQRNTGKAGPGSHVEQGFSRQGQDLQQSQTVQQMQLRGLGRIRNSGQVHDPVLLQNGFSEGQQLRDSQPVKAVQQCLLHIRISIRKAMMHDKIKRNKIKTDLPDLFLLL